MAASVLVAASAGCGLIAPLHDLSPDAGTDESNAPESDAEGTTDPDPSDGLDANSKSETAPLKDADADADAAQDAGPPFCLAYFGALACDDFDDGVSSSWSSNEGAGGNFKTDVDPTFSLSPSLRLYTIAYSGLPRVLLGRTFTKNVPNADCSFDFASDLGNGDQAPVRLFTFGRRDGSDFWRIEVVLQNGSIAANERTNTTTKALAKTNANSVPPGGKVPVFVSITTSPTPKFVLRIKNSVVPPTAEITPTLNTGSSEISVGLDFIGAPANLWSMRYDNVLCLEK